jgi:hypothetical protein
MRRVALAALAAIPLGAALGTAGQEVDAVVPHARWIAALGVPWLAVCWAAGALAGRALAGAVAGAVALTVATLTYYALHFHHFGGSLSGVAIVVGWGGASVAAGGVFGAAGGAWRAAAAPPRPGASAPSGAPAVAVRISAVALLAGALAGEAILLAGEWPQRVDPLLGLELLAAAALPFLLVRPWRVLPIALVLTAGAALILGAAEHEVRETLRLAGWKGL